MFAFNPNIISSLEEAISTERMARYLIATNGNKEAAFRLYLWNSEVSASFYIPLQGLEITLRNALHKAMCSHFGNAWYDRAPLDRRGSENVQAAKDNVRANHRAVNPPHVVAELSFGFWIALLNKKYHQTLWIPALGKAFPHARQPRSVIHETLNHIRILRNRIAHHEHIFGRHLAEDYRKIILATHWINPAKAGWVDQHNAVLQILSQKP